ncbi:MAG: hypothetical protein NVSMB48_00310 [Marmoricola sp.]
MRQAPTAAGAVFAALVLMPIAMVIGLTGANAEVSCLVPAGTYTTGTLKLNADQLSNARTITSMATAAGGTPAAVVALTAALTESHLHSDPGSLGGAYGVFQETPAQGWGSQAQVSDITYATTAFLTRLLNVPDWTTMPPWRAAQAVQRSGVGQASNGKANYGPNVTEATQLAGALGHTAFNCSAPTGVGNSDFTPNMTYAYVGQYPSAELYARARAYVTANHSRDLDPYFHAISGSWYRQCEAFAAVLSGYPASGFPTASAAWAALDAHGLAHPVGSTEGRSPPVGAWLYYAAPGAGHVAVYLGGGLVAGTDTWGLGTVNIGPANDITNGAWHLPYLGWATPTTSSMLTHSPDPTH